MYFSQIVFLKWIFSMYQKIAVITSLCFSSLFTLAVSAQDFYVEPVFATSELKLNSGNKFSYESVGLQLGWLTDSNYEYGMLLRTAINEDNAGGSEISMKTSITGYFGKNFPLSDYLDIYGQLGLTYSNLETKNSSSNSYTNSSVGLSYEAGVRYELTSQTAVRLGYQVYTPGDDQFDTESSFKLGFQWRW